MPRENNPFGYDPDDPDFGAKMAAHLQLLKEQEQVRREAAVKAIEFFINKYEPATPEDAEAFFSTSEIQNAILVHTGTTFQLSEIYETMSNMNFRYDAKNDLTFYWLLKRE